MSGMHLASCYSEKEGKFLSAIRLNLSLADRSSIEQVSFQKQKSAQCPHRRNMLCPMW